MSEITFLNQQAPKNKSALNIFVLLVIIILISLNQDVRNGIILAFSDLSQLYLLIKVMLIGGVIITVISYFYFFKKAYNNFSVDDQGLNIDGRKILWGDIKNWHLLGDSQDERIGLGSIKNTGGFDVVNIYSGTNVYVLKIKNKFINNTIRLQLSKERSDEFALLLQKYGLERESKLKMYLTGVSGSFMIFVIIPFGFITLWFIWQLINFSN